MAGLVPAIHVLLSLARAEKDMDARDKRGHDGVKTTPGDRNML
jgi:hypothetical protein